MVASRRELDDSLRRPLILVLLSSIGTLLIAVLPFLTLWKELVLTPAMQGAAVPFLGRLSLLLFGLAVLYTLRDPLREIYDLACSIARGSLTRQDSLDLRTRLQEAHAFLSGSGRVRSLSAAGERFVQTLERFCEHRFPLQRLPAPLVHALRGVMASYRGLDSNKARLQLLSRAALALRNHEVPDSTASDLLDALIDAYVEEVRSGYAPSASALFVAARSARTYVATSPEACTRICSTLSYALRTLPEQYLPIRIILGIVGLSAIPATHSEGNTLEQETLGLIDQLPPGTLRAQLISYMKGLPSLTGYGKTLLQALSTDSVTPSPKAGEQA